MAALRDPVENVIALCRTYIEMGKDSPGYAAILFRLDVLDDTDDGFEKRRSTP